MSTVTGYSNKIARWLGDDGKPEPCAWPGGYEVVYVTKDGGELCAPCASLDDVDYNDPTDAMWYIVGAYILEGGAEDYGYIQCDHCEREFFEEEMRAAVIKAAAQELHR